MDPHPLPPKASPSQLLSAAVTQILSIAENPVFGNDTCTRCQAALEIAKFLAMAEPEQGPPLAVQICDHFDFNPDCEGQYGIFGAGSPVTQAIANADVGGYDGQVGRQFRIDIIYPTRLTQPPILVFLRRMVRALRVSPGKPSQPD